MNVVLIGYRGTGKSSVAELLARRLSWPVFHMDREIAAQAGQSINEIVSRFGWEHFRDLESEAVLQAASRDRWVIDTGGGVIVRERNVRELRRNGTIFWLKADPATIMERIQDDTARPSLTGTKSYLQEIEEVLLDRTPRYQAAADYEIDTNRLSTDEAAEKILQIMANG